jgi:hypothetical protein
VRGRRPGNRRACIGIAFHDHHAMEATQGDSSLQAVAREREPLLGAYVAWPGFRFRLKLAWDLTLTPNDDYLIGLNLLFRSAPPACPGVSWTLASASERVGGF